jgi:hypothetical protein
MEYVMVPVPEEHADTVMNHLRWNVGKPAVADRWDEASIADLVEQADAPTRALLGAVAMAELDERELTVTEAAGLLEVSEREVVGTVIELNQLHQVPGAPTFVLMMREVPANDGAPAWGKRAIVAAPGVARLVRAVNAARAEDGSES